MDELQESQLEKQNTEKWYIPLTRNTPFSKYFALTLFVVIPFVGFWLGVEYQAPTNVPSIQQEVINNTSPVQYDTTDATLTTPSGNPVLGVISVYEQHEAIEMLSESPFKPFFTTARPEDREYRISCNRVNDFVRSVMGVCSGDDSVEITYVRDFGEHCTNCSNVEFKNNESVRETVLLAEAENERLLLLQHIGILLEQRIAERRTSGNSPRYVEELIRVGRELEEFESVWLPQREAMCGRLRDLVPPEATGTNGLYTFEYRSCLTYVTQQHVDYLRKVVSWLFVAKEPCC